VLDPTPVVASESPFKPVYAESPSLNRISALEDIVASLSANIKLVLEKLILDPVELQAVHVAKSRRTPLGGVPSDVDDMVLEEDSAMHVESHFGESQAYAATPDDPDGAPPNSSHVKVGSQVQAAKDTIQAAAGLDNKIVGSITLDGITEAKMQAKGLNPSPAASSAQALG
jgi:hypothetical protein